MNTSDTTAAHEVDITSSGAYFYLIGVVLEIDSKVLNADVNTKQLYLACMSIGFTID